MRPLPNPLRMRRSYLLILILTCACFSIQAQVNYITTIAGKAGVPASDSGDFGPATNCRFYGPCAIRLDKMGNIYIADGYNNRIRKIDYPTGIITTIAGIDSPGFHGGYNGDNILATNAKLSLPQFLVIDSIGNIYFTDSGNDRVRKITIATGIITTIAGTDNIGFTGDGGPATDAKLNGPIGICFDNKNNIYIADYYNIVIRKIDSLGIISTYAGNGNLSYTGDGGPAIQASFKGPLGILADDNGNIYIMDQYNHAVRKIDAITNIISTIAGNGTAGYSGDGGPAIYAQMNQPSGGVIDKDNNIYIAEFGNGVVRRIDAVTGIITTVAGNGTWGWAGDGGPATAAELSCTDLAIDNNGCMIIADYGTNTIRKVYNTKLGLASPQPYPKERVPYPNPATDELHIDNCANSDLIIYNLLGREMLAAKLKSDKETVGIKQLTPGTYLLKIITESGEVQNYRVVKE